MIIFNCKRDPYVHCSGPLTKLILTVTQMYPRLVGDTVRTHDIEFPPSRPDFQGVSKAYMRTIVSSIGGTSYPKGPCTQYLGTWDLGNSNSSIDFG